MYRSRAPRFLLLLALVLLAAPSARAQPEKILDTETGWSYLFSAASSNVTTQIDEGLRPFSLQRAIGGGYDVVSVANSGPYAVSGFSASNMHYTRSVSQLSTESIGRRIVSLDCFEILSSQRMHAITVPNPTGTVWGWQVDKSRQEIVDWINDSPTPLRILDLSIYTLNGQKRYAATAVANQGTHFQNWWWYFDKTGPEIATLLEQNSARLIDIELESAPLVGAPRFACVMVADNPGAGWFHHALTLDQVNDFVGQTGGRLTVLHPYTTSLGLTRYAVALVDNANAQTRRMRGYMGNQTVGSYGFKLKRINGPVIASLNENFVFEPASALKILHATYAIRDCALGTRSLDDEIYNINRTNTLFAATRCPPYQSNAGYEPLRDTIRGMMQLSHNDRTKTIEDLLGRETLNDFAQFTAGLENTSINHTMGCLCGNEYNQMNSADLVSIYEQIGNGTYFDSGWRDTMFSLMANTMAWGYGATSDDAFYTLGQVIAQEAANTNLTAAEIAEFRSALQYVNKGGAYGCTVDEIGYRYRTTGAWASIPFKSNLLGTWVVIPRTYAIATFVHHGVDPEAMIAYPASEEILREQIREALQTWDAACSVAMLTHPADRTVDQGEDAQFTANSIGVGPGEHLWQRFNGFAWQGLVDGPGTYSGATSPTLTVLNAQPSDAGSYRLRVTKDCGTVTSNAATLTVVPDDVTSAPEVLPTHLVMHAPMPNPFNPRVTLRYQLPQPTDRVELDIFDVAGRRVHTISRQALAAGTHEFIWTGVDATGRRVASGIYLARLSAGAEQATQRLVLVQ